MSVRLKFQVTEVATFKNFHLGKPPLGRVKLNPVVGGSEENKAFYEASPGGNIDFSTVNAAAAEQFEPGQEWYVTLERAPSEPAAS